MVLYMAGTYIIFLIEHKLTKALSLSLYIHTRMYMHVYIYIYIYTLPYMLSTFVLKSRGCFIFLVW